MLSRIIALALAALSIAAPIYPNTTVTVANQTTGIEITAGTACGTPNQFFVRGLWTWVPALNNTNAVSHFYMDFHDVVNNLHTSCFDDPTDGRYFDMNEWKSCVNKDVEFIWFPRRYHPNNPAYLLEPEIRIREKFVPCNPWFKTATIEKTSYVFTQEWPDNRYGPGYYIRTPSGEVMNYFNRSSIKTDQASEISSHGIWMN